MITHSFTRGWTNGGSTLARVTAVQSGAEENLDEAIPVSTTNSLVAFTMDVSQLQGIFIVCNTPVTIKTNSSGSPVNTITLAADVPYVWIVGDAPIRDTAGVAITVDITSLYITNPSASVVAQVQVRAIYD